MHIDISSFWTQVSATIFNGVLVFFVTYYIKKFLERKDKRQKADAEKIRKLQQVDAEEAKDIKQLESRLRRLEKSGGKNVR
jgi:hypothetical protein